MPRSLRIGDRGFPWEGPVSTYEEFVAPGTFVFRSRGDADRLHNVVKFRWEMVPRAGGDVAGMGLEVLVLGTDGRIVGDYQFIEG